MVSPVSFYVFRADGSRDPALKRCFLRRQTLDVFCLQDSHTTLEDGTVWRWVFEPEVKQAFTKHPTVACLVSYQARTDGNYAVVRRFDETRLTKKDKEIQS